MSESMRATSAVQRVRYALRALAALGMAALVCSLGPSRDEGLTSERLGAHARLLKSCGKKKACLKKPGVATAAAVAAASQNTGALPRARWKESEFDEVTVWIADGKDVELWRESHRYKVRDAFHAWTAAGAPVHFAFVADSTRADIHVLWRDSLPETRAGQVTRSVDRHGWVRAATIEMSTRNIAGGAQDSATVRAVALHEVGHLLGLEHSTGERDIMSAWVTATSLSRRDRAAVNALYGAFAKMPAENR